MLDDMLRITRSCQSAPSRRQMRLEANSWKQGKRKPAQCEYKPSYGEVCALLPSPTTINPCEQPFLSGTSMTVALKPTLPDSYASVNVRCVQVIRVRQSFHPPNLSSIPDKT